MSEKLKLFWTRPYWETEALDEWLASQEAAGWRLEGSASFRRLVFRAAEPKTSTWFVTYSEPRNCLMLAEANWLKRHCNADEVLLAIPFSGTFGWDSAFRILTPIDRHSLRELRLSRNLVLRRMARWALFMWLIALAFFGTITVWALTTRSFTLDAPDLFAFVFTALGLFWTPYHITGLFALRRRRRAYQDR